MIILDLDRSNLGNARLQGLTTDVLGGDPNGQLYGWLVSIFYFPYVCLLDQPGIVLQGSCLLTDPSTSPCYTIDEAFLSAYMVGFVRVGLGNNFDSIGGPSIIQTYILSLI